MNTQYGVQIGDIVLHCPTKHGRAELMRALLCADVAKDRDWSGEERFIPIEDNSWYTLVQWDSDRHSYKCGHCYRNFSTCSPIEVSYTNPPTCPDCQIKETPNAEPQS
jgi:hypothetical protein